jgi:hypothetical protein
MGPDVSTLDATGRILYKLTPDLLVELLGQLRARESGEAALRELLRVRQLRQHLAFCERRLARLGPSQDAGEHGATKTSAITPRRMLTGDDRWRASMPSGRSRSRRSPADTACPPLNSCRPARSSRPLPGTNGIDRMSGAACQPMCARMDPTPDQPNRGLTTKPATTWPLVPDRSGIAPT